MGTMTASRLGSGPVLHAAAVAAAAVVATACVGLVVDVAAGAERAALPLVGAAALCGVPGLLAVARALRAHHRAHGLHQRFQAPAAGPGCSNTCATANDGECDDGGPDSLYSICDLGTDCNDCGPRTTGMCTNTCATANDGECDDGGPNSLYSICDLGTDCNDCGTR